MTRFRTSLGILFLLTLFSAPALHAQAQPPAEPQEPAEDIEEEASMMAFGLKGGVNVGWLRNDDPTMDERVGYMAGLVVAIQPTPLVGVQVELLYSNKGYISDLRKIELDYLEMPVLGTVKLPKIGPVRPTVLTGVAPGLRLRTRYGATKASTQDAFRDDVKRFDLEWVAGLGLELPAGTGALTIEGRFTMGLLPVFVDGSSYAHGGSKNRAYVGLIGYRF